MSGVSMNRTDLKNAVAEKAGLTGTDADKAVAAVIDSIAEALVAGDKVTIPGFGTFETRHRAARQGRNPQTGESMEIAASTSAAFKPGSDLKRRLSDA
ncbi:HU family DNA-binding protein [Nocardioides euryhalodurans]|uniref:HU family DNA-binding protein n=2 Tax=Nocardioides euryhalodurans TaxID=2518370 RepID=A0A4P7GLT4_9ACTN|nr:HU family DNA-binding protein [Nocardioides euryhalodurans]